MTERVVGPERIVGVRVENGAVTRLEVQMADGSREAFVPEIRQPIPIIREGYIGKHEKTAGGMHHDGTYR